MAAAIIAAGVGALVLADVAQEVSARTLRQSFADIGSSLAASWSSRRFEPFAAPFLAGLGAGWCMTLSWTRRRGRFQSIVLVDNRRPDMTLTQLLSHIRRHASRSETEALGLVIAAAKMGELTTWRQSASSAVQRVPPKLATAVVRRYGRGESGRRSRFQLSAAELFFAHIEAQTLWPETPALMHEQPASHDRDT